MAGHQRRACRRTGGSHVVVGEARRFTRQGVDVWSLNNGIACVPKVAIALVISDDEHDVGPRRVRLRSLRPQGQPTHHQRHQQKTPPHKAPPNNPPIVLGRHLITVGGQSTAILHRLGYAKRQVFG